MNGLKTNFFLNRHNIQGRYESNSEIPVQSLSWIPSPAENTKDAAYLTFL